tara:strand:+ start:243 stop:605 length:363 start_codon:yes stop_codon:yes gene_type:complete
MPVKSTASTTATPRKRRTRKTSTKLPVTKKVVSAESVTKYTQIHQNDTVTETPQPSSNVEEKVTQTESPVVVTEDTKSLSDLTQLRGFDLIVLPLLFLEKFVVNILQNLDIKVPERVSIK